MEAASGVFQIRPHKDFLHSKGRDRLLSLRLLSELSPEESDLPDSSDLDWGSSNPTNAYDFMSKRRGVCGDPTINRWNASIRLSNFSAVESSPLCVRMPRESAWANAFSMPSPLCIDSLSGGIAWSSCSWTRREWFGRRRHFWIRGSRYWGPQSVSSIFSTAFSHANLRSLKRPGNANKCRCTFVSASSV